jgi:tRNA A-37 threonylcarbamoyl transferase component Bud32
MSAAPAPRPAAALITCPACKLTFPASDSANAAAGSPGSGTITILPEDVSSEPVTPNIPVAGSQPSRLGRFEITRYLGEGVFGRVYEAHDPLLRRTVALKVAKPEQLGGQKRVERFQREARAAANHQHPHIVAVFDSGSEDGFHYIASAFVPGRSLAAILEELPKGKTLELREAVQIVRKLAEALGYAHKQGVVHRDVKPGNVMLRDDGEPMLMDFGLAARRDETEKLTVAGQFMGTPEYTAPEQWRGAAASASDQYSLGCLLFELLTGERPFAGASIEHFLMLHTQVPAPSPRKDRVDLPQDLETVTLKCLEKEPARRYRDCQALADDLRRWLEGEAVRARQPGLMERLGRWTRRNPVVAGLLSAIVLLTVSALVAITGLYYHAVGEAIRAQQAEEQAEQDRDDAQQQAGIARRAETRARNAEAKAKRERNQTKAAKEQTEEQWTRAERLLYASQIHAAQREWDAGNVSQAWQHLQSCRWDYRNVEHRYLFTLFNHNHANLAGHTLAVSSVAISSDGKRIVSGSQDGTAKVWDAHSGKELFSLKGHTGPVRSVAISGDGKRIVSGSQDGTAKVWDAHSGRELHSL